MAAAISDKADRLERRQIKDSETLPVKINEQFVLISDNEAAMTSIYRWFAKSNLLGGNPYASPSKSAFQKKGPRTRHSNSVESNDRLESRLQKITGDAVRRRLNKA
jgi:hypothetical protein